MLTLDAIYARQSVDKADSLSIQGQIDLCRKESGADYQVYQDKGFSGKNTNRPAFQRLMADVEKGLVKKIVVYRLDRFSRSIVDFGRLWEILKNIMLSLSLSMRPLIQPRLWAGRCLILLWSLPS